MVGIGIGHGRVLTLHIHATDFAPINGLHDLDHREARLVIERLHRNTPGLGKALAHLGVHYLLIIGVDHGNQARIGCALDIVLATQGVESRPRLANLAGHQRERNQATGVVGAVHMLRDAHAPENHRALGGGIEPRHMADGLGIDSTDGCHSIWAVLANILLKFLVANRSACDEVLVDEALGHNHIHHGIEQGHVGVGLELQEPIGIACKVCLARIHDDELGAILGRVLHPCRGHGVIDRGIGPDDDHDLGLRHVHDRVRDRTRPQALEQGRHRRGVAEARAVVDVVGAETRSNQLLEEIGLFVAALGRAKASE